MTIQVRSSEPVAVATETKVEGAPAAETVEQSAPVVAATEQEQPTASDPVETEEEETETTETENKDGVTKKKSGFKRRIDKLRQATTLAQQETEYWKREALKNAGATNLEKPVEPKPVIALEGKPDPAKFDTHAEYVEAVTDWKIEQKQKERDQKQERSTLEAAQAAVVKSYSEREKEFAKANPDYKEVLSDVDGIQMSNTVYNAIVSSENGPQIAYELAKNPTEFARICALSPFAAALEMGEIRARFKKPSAESQADQNKITKAPAPITPVSSSGKMAAPRSLESAKTQAEFEAIWKEQQKQKRKQA